jgi:hypothetical protein
MKLSFEELKQRLAGCPEEGSFFRHYKTGDVYKVLGSAISEATQEPQVIYRPRGNASGVSFVRPLKEWDEPLAHEGRAVIRFERIR